MIFVWALLLAAAVSNVSGARVIGGETTSIEQYPSVVSIEYRNFGLFWYHFCGGTLMTRRWVLSGAQCFVGVLYANSNRRIRAGSSEREAGGVITNILRRINHRDYETVTAHDCDIAVVEVERPFEYGINIAAVRIPSSGYETPFNMPVFAVGWGQTTPGGSYSDTIRQVSMNTINNQTCAARYQSLSSPRVVTENMICTGRLNVGGADACEGDYGGPIFFQNIQIGITSWSESCGSPNFPGVSTKVSAFTTWIIQNAV